jgi:hypothetical protein
MTPRKGAPVTLADIKAMAEAIEGGATKDELRTMVEAIRERHRA